MRRFFGWLMPLVLVACGSGEPSGFASRMAQAPQSSSQDVPVLTATAAHQAGMLRMSAPVITADQLFDWAEATFPQFFPIKATSADVQDYRYRYYPSTDTYLAVQGGQDVLVIGALTENRRVHLGPMQGFAPAVAEFAARQKPDPRVAALGREIDAFVQPYLAANGITAATLAVVHNGQLIYEKAYGHQNAQATVPLRTDALLSGASIVKPVTAAAIQRLRSDGLLADTDFVFCRPNVTAACWIPSGWVSSSDARVYNIRISDLVAHKGGWDRAGENCRAFNGPTAVNTPGLRLMLRGSGLPCDPLQHDALLKSDLNLSRPATTEETIRYFMAANLDYAPGAPAAGVNDRYSNFGYMLLGHIIERASGQTYNSYIHAKVLGPLGVSVNDFKNGNSLLSQADPREPNYITSLQLPSVFGAGLVNARDGGINAINWVSTATTLMTAQAMARFASAYKIDTDANGIDGPTNGQPLLGGTHDGFHGGDLPGSASLVRQLRSGVAYAVMMNKNDKFEGSGRRVDYPLDMKTGIDRALARAGY